MGEAAACSGVPVSSSLCAEWKERSACDTCDWSFLSACPSSTMR